MNPRTWAAVLAVTLATAACKSTGADKAEDTSKAMRSLYQSMEAAPAKIDAVTTSLNVLAKGEGDMRKQYDTFVTTVNDVLSHREKIRSLRAQVQANKDEFEKQWQMRLYDIKDAELRERANQRQKEVVAEFSKVSEASEAAKQAFEPWIQNVIDVRTYLENDLNASGVASVKDRVEKISKDAGGVNKSITDTLAKVQELAKKIEANKPPPPPPETKSAS